MNTATQNLRRRKRNICLMKQRLSVPREADRDYVLKEISITTTEPSVLPRTIRTSQNHPRTIRAF